jgi:alpha-glucosidase (family GH31 glycosyl hydrolase)
MVRIGKQENHAGFPCGALPEVWDEISSDPVLGVRVKPLLRGLYAVWSLLTGVTHLLPRATYGYIQSKAIYPTQEQVLDVAKAYRKKNLPLDVMVVDFLNMTKQGEMDLDPKRWPDPAAMNRELHAMGVGTLLSVWPHYSAGTQFYDMLLHKGWLIHAPDGKPDSEGYTDAIGPNIDTTNPEAAKWFWEKIRDRYGQSSIQGAATLAAEQAIYLSTRRTPVRFAFLTCDRTLAASSVA